MPGQAYTPRHPTNRARLPRDPTPSRTLTCEQAHHLDAALDGRIWWRRREQIMNEVRLWSRRRR
jgi:hypothetical protein